MNYKKCTSEMKLKKCTSENETKEMYQWNELKKCTSEMNYRNVLVKFTNMPKLNSIRVRQ